MANMRRPSPDTETSRIGTGTGRLSGGPQPAAASPYPLARIDAPSTTALGSTNFLPKTRGTRERAAATPYGESAGAALDRRRLTFASRKHEPPSTVLRTRLLMQDVSMGKGFLLTTETLAVRALDRILASAEHCG